MEGISDRIRKIFEGLDENEKFGLFSASFL